MFSLTLSTKQNKKRSKHMKKIFALMLAALMALALAACGGEETPTGENGTYRIAIVKQMDHLSLNEISDAVVAELEAIAAEKNMTITYDVFSGQGDSTLLGQIGSQIIADDYDAIIPIATLAAQVMAASAEDSQLPVVYAAISDPAEAGLTGLDYVTGVCDALDTTKMLDMMLAQNPNVQTVGLLYSLSEPNSTNSIQQAKEYLDSKNIAYQEATGNNNEEVMLAASTLSNMVDAIFTPTDNIVMASELTISELFAATQIPHYAGADSFVKNGAFASCGVNYTDLGAKAAQMTIEVLETGTVPQFYTMEGDVITVNTETAEAIGADYSMFSDMGTIVEVTTAAE